MMLNEQELEEKLKREPQPDDKIFVISHPNAPDIFTKCQNAEEAYKRFFIGIHEPEKYKDAIVRELTMELLMELTPQDFQIEDDSGF